MRYLPAIKFLIEKKPLLSVIAPGKILENFMLADSTGLPAEITLPFILAVCEDTVVIKWVKKKVRKNLYRDIIFYLFCSQIYNC